MSPFRQVAQTLVSVLSFALFHTPAQATTAVEQTFPDLVHRADIIAVGTVTAIDEHWDAVRRAPFTLVTFSDLTILKGHLSGERLTLHFLGGHTPNGILLSIPGVPHFTLGEKTVVFCAGNRRAFCPLVGIWQGVVRVAFDPERGLETIRDNFHVPIVGVRQGQFLKLTPQTATQEPLSLGAFIRLIQTELRSSYEQP